MIYLGSWFNIKIEIKSKLQLQMHFHCKAKFSNPSFKNQESLQLSHCIKVIHQCVVLTSLFAILCLLQQVCLFGRQNKSQDRHGKGVEDEDNGEDEGPADLTLTHTILVGVLTTRPLNHLIVPSVGVYDAAQGHTHT